MKIFRAQFRRQKWTLCLCLFALASPDLRAQRENTAELELEGQKAEIQGLLNDGIFLEAIRKLENYLEERPGDIAARRQLSKAYLEVEDYFRLRYHSGVILQEFPEDPEALVWSEIADEVIAEKYPAMVKDLLDALEEDPENTVLRRELISLYMTGDEGEKAAEQFRILLDLQPENEALWLDYARNLFWSNQLEASLVAYEQYLKVAEEPKDVRLEIARVHAANKQFGIAVEQLRNLIEDVPDNHAARALLADIFRWNDDAMAAEEIYRGILEEDPEHGPSLKGLEELAEMARRRVVTTASMNIDSMREKVEEDPEDMDLVLQLARLYTANNRYAEAAETYAKYLDKRPDETPIRREYSFTLSIEEEYDEAIRQLRIYLQEYPEDMTERMRIARMLIWQGNNQAAKRELLDMESQIPDNPELHWNLARIYEIEGDWPRAIARYETLRKHSPRFEVATAKIREIESNPYYQIAMLERRIEKDPNDSEARLQLARTFLDLERFYEAQQQAQAVLDYAPEDEQAQRIVGWADFGISEVRRERIEELLRVLDEDPENFEATLELARLYREEDDYPEALRYYYTYLNAFPQDREARLEYARLLSWQPEQRESAIREYAILIEDQPDNIDLRLTYLELLSAEGALTADHRALMAEIEEILRDRLFADREDAETLVFMGRLYQINSKWFEALDFYRAAVEVTQSDDPQESTIRERIESILALPDFQLAELFTQVEENPSDVPTRLILARQLFDLKRYFEAKEQATQVLAYDADNVEASRIVGWSDIGIEEVLYERIRTARSEIRENPNDMEAALSLARALKEAEIYPESLRYYYHYLKVYPGDVDVRQEYAQVLSWEPSQLNSAVREFEVLAAMRPDDLALQLQYYELIKQAGELSRRDLTVLSSIEDRLRERIFFNDMDSEALFYLGRLHQLDDNWNSALDYYEAAIAAGSLDSTIQDRIATITANPDFQIATLEARAANNPEDLELNLSLVRLLLQNERYYQAQQLAEQLLQFSGRNQEARDMYNYASSWIEAQQAQDLQNLRVRVTQNPRDLDAQLELARILRNEGAFEEARQRYRLYLRAFPEDLEIRREYADTLAWSGENSDEAISEYRDLLFAYPHDRELKLQYARMLSWNPKYWNEAEEVLEELAIYERENPEIVLMKADILRFRGRYSAAQRLYDQVLQRGAAVDGYYYDDREQRYIYQNADVGTERMSDRIPDRVPARMSDRVPNRMPDRMIDRMPARDLYRPNFDDATVRSYRDSILDTNPNSPRNMMRYPQGSLSPQSAPAQPQNSVDQATAAGHARDERQASAEPNRPVSPPKVGAPAEAAPAQQQSLMLAGYSGEKIEWRRPEPADYQVVRAEMVLDPTDRNPRGARNYAQRPTGSEPEDGRYEANRRADSLRPASEPMRPLRSPETESVAEAQPPMTLEVRPLEARPIEARPIEARPRPERYGPEQRDNVREFYDAPEQVVESGRYSERAPRTTVRPQFERSDAPAERRSRPIAEDPQFSPSRTYTIPGDPQVRAEPPAPAYTRPEPVERVMYREPVYEVRPEVIIQREIEYVPVPDRYVELPRHNLDDRRIFDDDRVVTRAPARRAEPRVFMPQYEPLPEPPRFYRERDRGLDTRIGTSLPSPSINQRTLFDDQLREPARYDYSRTPLEPAPVRYIRERVATPEGRDPYGEYRSTLPPPTRFNPGRTSYREPRPSSSFREAIPQRRYESPELSRVRNSRVMEPDSRGYYPLPDSEVERRTRAWEGESFDDRRWREPERDPQFRESVRDPRLREPERDPRLREPESDPRLRETRPPARNQGLPYYYNSTGEDYQTPKYSAQPSIRFERAQYQPQSNLFIQPNDRDRRQMRDYGRPEDRQSVGQRNQSARSLMPQGYARPDDREFVRPRDRGEPERRPSDWSRGESRDAAMYQRPARSYTLPAAREARQPRTYADEAARSQAPAPTYRRPVERQPIQPRPRTYADEAARSQAPAPTYRRPVERQPIPPRTYMPESGRAPVEAPRYNRPQTRQPMPAESSWREMERRPAQAPTSPLRFEGDSSTINRLPYEERGRTYLAPENTPISVPPQMERLPRQTDNFNRELLEQPRAVPATEATTFGRSTRPIAVRAPRPAQTVERIQGVPFTADSVFNNEAYARALQGKRAIAQLLRPELMVDFGYESDTDGFTGTHIGGRYNHFTSAGNLYYLGLSFDNYTEDDLTPIDSIDAQSLLFGASGYMNERLRGFADFTLTNYSDGPDTTLSFTGGGSYNLDGVNTLTASYSHFDFFREAKTVRSLLGDVSADRFRVDWTSNPIEEVEGRPFGERIFFEGSLAFTSLSDDNSSIAYSLRPYYRIADNPNIDVSVGWQGLSYADQSPLYYSPENNQGPTLGARISGETLWGLIYDVRGLVTFPTEEASSRSLLFNLRKDFTNHFSAGANIFLTEAPRADDDDYRFGSLLFDLRYQF